MRSALAALFLGTSIGVACAADVPPAEPEGEWELIVAPYIWAIAINGDVAAFGSPTVDVDVTFSELLEHFAIGLMGVAEASNDRFSVAADLLWVKLSDNENTPFGILAHDVAF